MAASTKGLSVLFLVLLVLAHSHVQARESKFFSKVTHSTNVATSDHVEEKKLAQIEIPAAAPEYSLTPGPAPAYVEKEYGYGLYGHDSDMLPPARETFTPVTTVAATTTTTNVNEKQATATPATATANKDNNLEDQFVREELSGESFQTGYTNNNYNYDNNNGYSNNDNYNNNNGFSNNYNYNGYANTRETNGYANNYNTNAFTSTYSTTDQSENYNTNGYSGNANSNGYGTERQGMSDTRYVENGKYSYNVKSDNSYLNGYEPEKAATGKQGMSDTRYLENGKYSYNVKSDNSYLNGYEPEKAATGNYVNYDENSSNSNEFDTMEEYYKKQGYQESQEVNEP
ncbi:protein E6 [Syzygium oleosum]|uniref:protein E6 n=1 Tax=Syzygium oleosum TaxID=219896 RepID=UPI0024BBD972|nr:protein E6 [Syzygium oleosum]